MSGTRALPGDVAEIPWRLLADAEFASRAASVVESWLDQGLSDTRLLVVVDDELQQRLHAQRARRRRAGSGALSAEVDLRALCYLLLMATERACEAGAARIMVTRALRLAGLHALSCLLEGEAIAPPTWSYAHAMFGRAEAAGDAALVNDLGSSDEALYLRMLLLSTLAGNGMSARQLDKCFDWLEEWSRGIALDRQYDPARHYFATDLGGGAGLVQAEGASPMSAPRYFPHAQLAARVAGARSEYFRQISVATLGDYGSNPLFEYHDALHQLSRYWEYVGARLSGGDTGRQRVDGVAVAAEAGFDRCIAAAAAGRAGGKWSLVDISPTGAGFTVAGTTRPVEKGALVMFGDPDTRAWVLATAVRVVPSAQGTEIGVKRLAENWRLVTLTPEPAAGASAAPASRDDGGVPAFFIFGDESRGLADSLVMKGGAFDPNREYTLQPGRDAFRVRLSRVIQGAGDWERVGFDVVKRFKAQH